MKTNINKYWKNNWVWWRRNWPPAKALFETMASALNSASGSVYAKHAQLSNQPRSQASLSRIQSQIQWFRWGPNNGIVHLSANDWSSIGLSEGAVWAGVCHDRRSSALDSSYGVCDQGLISQSCLTKMLNNFSASQKWAGYLSIIVHVTWYFVW